jgi:hypothetical protein
MESNARPEDAIAFAPLSITEARAASLDMAVA